MKKSVLLVLLTLLVAVPLTWFIAYRQPHSHDPVPGKESGERKVMYYQSAMHPWIKSDKPGRCTICGMELTPVYEGDRGFDAAGGGDVVPLSHDMIHVMNVQTAEVQIRPLKKTLTVAGMIDDDATRHRVLSAYIPGRIDKLYVNYVGAEVQEGQPLAEFYSPGLLQAEREYRIVTGELREAAAFRLRQMGMTPSQIEALSRKPAQALTSQILAPIGGTVVSQNVFEGQYVQEGERLFEIADFSIMWFQFNVYEQDLPWIRPGLKVDVSTPSHPGYVFSGKISFVEPNLDASTRSTKARVELENPRSETGHRMLHRLYADGLVHLEAPEVLTLPRAAVIHTGGEPVAYVDAGGGAYARRALKTGRRGDEFIEVLAGLEAGERVVVNGNLLMDGQAEMNRAFGAADASMDKPSASLTDSQKEAVKRFIVAVDRVSEALAKDDVAGFNAAGSEVIKETESVAGTLKGRPDLEDILEHLSAARHLHGARDLPMARKLFHPFSNAAARLLQLLREPSETLGFEIFECPMVDRAIPGVPKRGRWVQVQGRNLANPYFGSEMLDCGVKVKL